MSDSEQTDVSLDDEIGALIDGAAADETPEEAAALEAIESETNEAPNESAAPTEQEIEEAIEALSPPDRWDPKYKEAFNALNNPEGLDPRAVQQAWLDYHAERQGYHTQLEQERAQYQRQLDEFNQVLSPYEASWQMAGLTPAQGVRQLMGWAGALQKDPQGTIERLAKSVGIDLGEYAQQKLQEREWVDPQVSTLNEQVTRLQNELRTMREHSVRAQAEAKMTAIDQQLADFANATDDHGNPAHPHFAELEATMAGLYTQAVQDVQRGARQSMPTLDELYDQAAWAHPEIRAQLLERQAQDSAARNAGAAQKAATASRSVKSKGAGTDTSPPVSLEEEVGAAYDAMAG